VVSRVTGLAPLDRERGVGARDRLNRSVLSIGSIGSAGSILSVGSAVSSASVLSAGSRSSILSAGKRDALLGEPAEAGRLIRNGALLIALGAALVARGLSR